MIRMSELRNRPVILEGVRIGFVQSVWLDSAQKMVRALVLACGIRGKRIVYASDIAALSEEFILANRVERYERSKETKQPEFVRDTTGLLVGRITDYIIDPKMLSIAAFEMIRGYRLSERRSGVWVFSFEVNLLHEGEVIVPTCLADESGDHKEESECVCQR